MLLLVSLAMLSQVSARSPQGRERVSQRPASEVAAPEPSLSGEETISVRTREVFIDVLVRDKRTGAAISDLTRENFTVLDEGVPRQLTHFARAGAVRERPLALFIIFDISPGGAGRFLRDDETVRRLSAAIGQLPPEDEVAALALSVGGVRNKPRWLFDLTRDRAALGESLESLSDLIGREGNLRKGVSRRVRRGARRSGAHRLDAPPGFARRRASGIGRSEHVGRPLLRRTRKDGRPSASFRPNL